MTVREKLHQTVSASTLADWIDRQPQAWWFVDGDPELTAIVDFPCPSDELALAIRRIGRNLFVQDRTSFQGGSEIVDPDKLNEFCNTEHNSGKKTLLLSWEKSDVDWLLIEDKGLFGDEGEE
jgi:hypothetical protein